MHIMPSNMDFAIIAVAVRLVRGRTVAVVITATVIPADAIVIINWLMNGGVSQADTLIFL